MEDGYIKLFRKLLHSRVFQNEGLLKVWIWCLLRARYQERWVSIETGRGKTEVWLEPGEFIFGRHTASRELRMKPSTVWERILKLRAMEMISIKSESHFSILLVLNWALYQTEEPRQMPISEKPQKTDRQPDQQTGAESLEDQASQSEHDKSLTGNPTPNRQATDTNKKVKNIKTFSSDSSEIRLASLLLELILQRKPDFKRPNLQSWGREIDLMIRRDGRVLDRIEAVIRWCQFHSFWRNNILSMAKLRKQFDQLELQMGDAQRRPEDGISQPVNKEPWY